MMSFRVGTCVKLPVRAVSHTGSHFLKSINNVRSHATNPSVAITSVRASTCVRVVLSALHAFNPVLLNALTGPVPFRVVYHAFLAVHHARISVHTWSVKPCAVSRYSFN